MRKLNTQLEQREFSLHVATEMFDDNVEVMQYTVLVITSERSCCGKLNSDVLTSSKTAINSFLEDKKIVKLISVGWKGRDSFKSKYKTELSKCLFDIGKTSLFLSYVTALCVFDTTFDKCAIYFSKYYKIFEQASAVYEFTCFDLYLNAMYNNRRDHLLSEFLVSNCLLVLQNFYNYNVCLIILDAFEENKYSELGCRAFSMEMAHRNASDLIQAQMLVYNKARQASITTDLLEVVSGAIYTA